MMKYERGTLPPVSRQICERMMKMKKTVSLILALVMVAALSGCDQLDRLRGIELPAPPTADAAEQPAETPAVEPLVIDYSEWGVVAADGCQREFDSAKGAWL